MLAKTKQQNVSDSTDEYRHDVNNVNNDQYYQKDGYNHDSNYLSASEDTNKTDSFSTGACDPVSPQDQWTLPCTIEKSWNYQSVLRDGIQPATKIQAKSRSKKLKTKKSRDNSVQYRSNLSSLHDNKILKTRLKLGSSRKKSKSKQNLKLRVSFGKSKVNGLSSKSSAADRGYCGANSVPNNNAYSASKSKHLKTSRKEYKSSNEESEYAQYLELKPSVKFKCSRCGINDFCTMSSLQAHMVYCNGHASSSDIVSSLPEHSTPNSESLQHSSVARNLKFKRKVLFCASCCTYFEYYKQYMHMRETHELQICLFCTKTFSTSVLLWDHLVTVHNLNSTIYSSATQIRDAFKSFYITCCACNSVFSERDKFDEHHCASDKPSIMNNEPLCSNCRPTNELPAAIELNESSRQFDKTESTDDSDTPQSGGELTSEMSTLDVIGVSGNYEVSSLVVETGTGEVATALKVHVSQNTSLEHLPPTETSAMMQSESCLDLDKTQMNKKNQFPDEISDTNDVPAVNDDKSANKVAEMQPGCNDDDHHSVPENEQQAPVFVRQVLESPTVENIIPIANDTESGSFVSGSEAENAETSTLAVVQNKLAFQPLTMALMLDGSLSSMNVQTVIKECVRTSGSTCLYCRNATVISVNGSQLASHLNTQHRFMPTKNEDSCENVIQKLEQGIANLKNVFINATSTSSFIQFDGTFSCLQCSFKTSVFKDLCHHKRKTHHKVIFLCIMCKCNFLHFSQLLCHFCPGSYSPEAQHTLNYHCCFCNLEYFPSAFRLVVHLRKIHQACDICLTRFNNQSELFGHMKKQHKMNYMCYKCNLAYRNRDGINEHLFWKHGTESVLCKRCLQKKWPHAYHFCIPATSYTCEECGRIFTKAVALTVHRRAHNGEFPFNCSECNQKFISKKMLSVHLRDVHDIKPKPNETETEVKEEDKSIEKSAEGENDKKEKKKKRKKKTDIEKPLLDELKPLNLSSESDDDSAEEETVNLITKSEPVVLVERENIEMNLLPYEENAAKMDKQGHKNVSMLVGKNKEEETVEMKEIGADAAGEGKGVDVTNGKARDHEKSSNPPISGAEPEPKPKPQLKLEEVPLERMKSCLIIEHSYCIPDSIFRSENPDLSQSGNDNSFEGVDPRLLSPKTLKSHEKCKSVTPHKKKRSTKKDSSSSESSSDTDSSSSSCGSNCSCNRKSNSNCSYTSSGSEYSTTPDKSKNKLVVDNKVDCGIANDEDESHKEQMTLLNARESDLDTDIITSDEDFYDEHPCLITRVEPKHDISSIPVSAVVEVPKPSCPIVEPYITNNTPIARAQKNRKRRRAPKITINIASQSVRPSAGSDFSVVIPKVDGQLSSSVNSSFSSLNTTNDGQLMSYWVQPGFGSSLETTVANNGFNSSGTSYVSSGRDSSGRKSKRERVKNKFYGYSSGEEASGNEMLKSISNNRGGPAQKRLSKLPKVPFVGIRAKKPLIMPIKKPLLTNTPVSNPMAITHPSLPPHLYRMPSYIMQQQQKQQLQQQPTPYQNSFSKTESSSNSDNSDSDNLVINELPINERTKNHQPTFRFPIYPQASTTAVLQHEDKPRMPMYSGRPELIKSGQKLYCYCRCPYDEVSDMVGCDGKNCEIEWFHFECVGIMVAPKGKWYCPNCRKNQLLQ